MKRALLIAGGTVGGIGAVLSITPPQIGSSGVFGISSASATTSLPAATATPAATNTPNSNTAAVTTSNSTATAAVTKTKKATPKATKTSKPTTTAGTSSIATNSSVNGSFTGDAVDVGYGIVQVKITVAGGKITEATAVQSPTGRSQRFSDYALPNLRQQTLTVQSAAIQGVSGASYTSYGWYKSLISALTKAGLKTGV